MAKESAITARTPRWRSPIIGAKWGLAVAEILGTDDHVAGLDLVREAGIEAAHGARGERVGIGEADVLDAYDLVDVEVHLLEDVGDAATQGSEAHGAVSAR